MKINHIGIAVKDENKALEQYKLVFPDLQADRIRAKDGHQNFDRGTPIVEQKAI